MTLIAATLNYKRPLVISDCLVSAQGVTNECPIPLLPSGYTKFFKDEKKTLPIALKQKMYIINKNVCIVFATDDEDEIKTFLPIFKEYFPIGSNLSNERIHEFLGKYGLEKYYSQSSFLIFYFNRGSDSISVGQFYRPAQEVHVASDLSNIDSGKWNILSEPVFETTWAHATGAYKFLNLINQPLLFYESSFPKERIESALQMNGALIAKLLALQATAEGFYAIEDDWGGVFEIAFFNGVEFEKLDNYSYLVFHSQFDQQGDIGVPTPIFILHIRYVGKILFVTEIKGEFENTEDSDDIMFTAQTGSFGLRVFAIEGVDIDDKSPVKFPTDLSFATDVVGVGYSLITKSNSMYNPGFFSLGTEVKITYRKDKNVKIFIRKKIWDLIKEVSKQQYPFLV